MLCSRNNEDEVDQADHLLGRQVSMRQIADTLNRQQCFPDTRIIACNLRAHGLEFYLDRVVDVTSAQAALVLAPTAARSRRLHHSSKSVARELKIAPGTVMVHKRNLFGKLGISSQYELFSLFIDDLGKI